MSTDRALLAPYCTNLDRPVFALRNLPEEVVAVLFAYYSRSTDSLRDNLARLITAGDLALQGAATAAGEGDEWLGAAQERARQFHEKWVVGYGHSSVAEHAVVHLAVEDISIVATKVIEDCRLASFTEKSTRYVPFDGDSFVRDPAVVASGLLPLYEQTCRSALETYTRLLPVVEAQVAERFPCPPDWPARRYASTTRAKACDLLRYLLPAATRTNLGLTCNARLLEHLLTKLYSHPLGELRDLAGALQREATAIVPTLIKYAAPNAYQQQTRAAVAAVAADLPTPAVPAPGNLVRLVRAPDDPVGELATAILYEAAHLPYADVRAHVATLSAASRQALVDTYLAGRGRWDAPLRGLEHVSYTFEILLDYGAYRDIQRHRMCTQTAQTLTTHHGYETPPELRELGHGAAYDAVMAQAAAAWTTLAAAVGEESAQYVLPLAWRKRLLLTCNLRELHHFISLRSGRQGHVSYRRVAQDCWHELHRVHPTLAAAVRVDHSAYDLARA